LIAFFPEQLSRRLQHLRFLKTGFTFASCHPNQTIPVKDCGRIILMNGH
jgi:hypothetical protein